jgi:hypothetical protein
LRSSATSAFSMATASAAFGRPLNAAPWLQSTSLVMFSSTPSRASVMNSDVPP